MVTALLYVQHLLGIGHLIRAGALARGLEAGGIRVVLVSGGMPVPVLETGAIRFEQLPPVRAADESFKVLLGETGSPVDDTWKAKRRECLLAILDRERPDIVITELFPFGRRQMRFELEPFLERARTIHANGKAPIIASSVRDIIVPSTEEGRNEEIIARIRRYYDLVLIHGDQNLIPFERSFPRAAEIADRIHSTGYVIGPVPARQGPGAPGYDEVIVSAGGGAVSEDFLSAAIGARALCTLRERTWRVLVGHNYPEEAFRSCQAGAPRGVVVERARGDFAQLLANCTLSISQGGYNTVTEILATGARAVCLPFSGGKESEQSLRCRILSERGLLQMVEGDFIRAEGVAAAIDRAMTSKLARGTGVDMNGAKRSAALLLEAVKSRR